jgi:HK97 family phage major capsid protein
MTGLQGNIAIPKGLNAFQTYWLSPEGADITPSGTTFGQVLMSSKVVGALTSFSYLMLSQPTLDIESYIRKHLAIAMSLEIDRAALFGSGAAGQPLGLFGQAGTNVVSLGTNGGALSYAKLTDAMKAVEVANADNVGATAWLGNANVKYSLMNTLKSTADTASQFILNEPYNQLLGHRVEFSEQVAKNLTKGTGTNLNGFVYGAWNALTIGQWNTAEIVANIYGQGFASGSTDVRILNTADVAMTYPQAFSLYKDVVA